MGIVNDSAYSKLSDKQKLKLFLTPCKDRKSLSQWILLFTNLYLPDQTVSRYADTNPLDAVWHIYDICVNKNNPDDVEELLYVAARGAGKTLAIAVAEFMIMLHDQRDVAHVGAILAQAKRCYDYQVKFMLNDRVKALLNMELIKGEKILDKMNMEKTSFNMVDRFSGKKITPTIEIVPCTLKACLLWDHQLSVDGKGLDACDVKPGELLNSPLGHVKVLQNEVEYKECLEIELDDGTTIRGSRDHRIYTDKGWVELQNLTDEHEILKNVKG